MIEFSPFEDLLLHNLGIPHTAKSVAQVANLDTIDIEKLREIFDFTPSLVENNLKFLEEAVSSIERVDRSADQLIELAKKLQKLRNDTIGPVQNLLNVIEKKMTWEEHCRWVASLSPAEHQEARDTVKRLLPKLKPIGSQIVVGRDFFFIHKDSPESDKKLFCGPLTGQEEWITFDDTWTMANIFVAVGLFPSITQARKNNAGGPIEKGFSHLERSKKQKIISIVNKFD